MSNNALSTRHLLKTVGASTALTLTPLASMAQQRPVLQWASSSLGSTGYVIVSVLAATANKFTDTRNASMSTSGASEKSIPLG